MSDELVSDDDPARSQRLVRSRGNVAGKRPHNNRARVPDRADRDRPEFSRNIPENVAAVNAFIEQLLKIGAMTPETARRVMSGEWLEAAMADGTVKAWSQQMQKRMNQRSPEVSAKSEGKPGP
ncbi:MAG: hypothetical protein KIT75_09540 [Planctomycetota bacterium]|nr:hypothetical protein [Planctomycetota bacterium]